MKVQQQKFSDREKSRFAWIVNLIFPLGGMSTDIYLPSLPAMSDHFGTTKALLQLTVTAFVVGMGLAQFVAGPISDAYGRKKQLLLSVIVQFVAALYIIISPNVYGIIISRLIQGISGGFMMVPARAVINDIFTGNTLKKHFNYMTISFALAPIIAPYIGGYFQTYFGWKSNFIFLIAYQILVLLLLCFGYSESLADKKLLSVSYFKHSYFQIFSNKRFLITTILASILIGFSALFSIMGPFLVQVTLHKKAYFYGELALVMGVAWFLGNLLNRILLNVDEKIKTTVALLISLLTALAQITLIKVVGLSILTLSIPIFIMIMMSGLIFPIYVSEALMQFSTNLAGAANGCLFSMTWFGYGFYTVIGVFLKASSAMPIAIAYLVSTVACLAIYYGMFTKLKVSEVK